MKPRQGQNLSDQVVEAVQVGLTYCAVAAIFEVNLQFAALLAGYGIVGGLYGTQRERFATPVDAISKVSFGVFVPIYFGIIGYRLVFGRQFSFAILVFLVGAWLRFVLSKGWPLLSTNPDETWKLGEATSGTVLPQGTEGATV